MPSNRSSMRGATDSFLKEVFSAPEMSQEEVVSNINRMNKIVDSCMSILLQSTGWIELNLHPYVHLILHGNFRNKLVLESTTFTGDEDDFSEEESKFLASSMVMAYSFVDTVSYEEMHKAFFFSKISRSTKECLLQSFLSTVSEYPQLYRRYARLASSWLQGQLVDTTELNQISQQKAIIEGVVQASMDLQSIILQLLQYNRELSKIRESIVRSYRRLAVKLAKKYSPTDGSYFMDNYQNGCSGLVKAVAYYNPDKGARFSQVANTWIRQALLLFLKETSNFVRIAQQGWSQSRQFDDAVKKLELYLDTNDITEERIAVQYLHSKDATIDSKSIQRAIERRSTLGVQIKMTHVKSIDSKPDENPISDAIIVDPDEYDDEARVSLRGLTRQEKRVILLYTGGFHRLKSPVNKSLIDAEIKRQTAAANL